MRIESVQSNFVREPLLAPFGFKGGYLSELWQSVARISTVEHTGIGAKRQPASSVMRLTSATSASVSV